MTATLDDELHALRLRAYGPNADIHLDTAALARLRELEDASRPQAPPAIELEFESDPIEQPIPLADEEYPEEAIRRRFSDGWERLIDLAGALGKRIAHARRSTVLIVVSLALIVVVAMVALVVVQRVQTDPLQVGARQVARLSVDTSFEPPPFFADMAEGVAPLGFQEFYGLRAVVSSGGFFGRSVSDECLSLYSSTDVTNSDSDSFSGHMMGGCAAGDFPAMIQFRADITGFPDDLSAAFPGSTALQFVYDRDESEVVVFSSE